MNGSDANDRTGGETAADGAAEGWSPRDGPSLEVVVEAAAAETTTASQVTLDGVDRAERPGHVCSVLVAVADGPHSGATVDVAKRIAETADAWIELFHVIPSDDPPERTETAVSEDRTMDARATGERLLATAGARLGEFDRVDRWLVENDAVADAIVDQSPYYDLVVVGAPTAGTVGRLVFGSTTDAVVERASVPVVVVEADGSTSLT